MTRQPLSGRLFAMARRQRLRARQHSAEPEHRTTPSSRMQGRAPLQAAGALPTGRKSVWMRHARSGGKRHSAVELLRAPDGQALEKPPAAKSSWASRTGPLSLGRCGAPAQAMGGGGQARAQSPHPGSSKVGSAPPSSARFVDTAVQAQPRSVAARALWREGPARRATFAIVRMETRVYANPSPDIPVPQDRGHISPASRDGDRQRIG